MFNHLFFTYWMLTRESLCSLILQQNCDLCKFERHARHYACRINRRRCMHEERRMNTYGNQVSPRLSPSRKLQQMQSRSRLTFRALDARARREISWGCAALDACPAGCSVRILGNCKCFAIACLTPSRTKQRHFSPGANMEISYAPAAPPHRARWGRNCRLSSLS